MGDLIINRKVFDYTKLSDEQLNEQIRLQKVRLDMTGIEIPDSQLTAIHGILEEIKCISREMNRRKYKSH